MASIALSNTYISPPKIVKRLKLENKIVVHKRAVHGIEKALLEQGIDVVLAEWYKTDNTGTRKCNENMVWGGLRI